MALFHVTRCVRSRTVRAALAFLAILSALPAAQAKPAAVSDAPWDACFSAAAQLHQVNEQVIRAIARQESAMRPQAVRQNRNGSVDLGLMQVNSLWLDQLAAHGIDAVKLMDPCINIYVGAWILGQQIRRHGNTWKAIGAYHSMTPGHNERYAWAIHARLQRKAQAR